MWDVCLSGEGTVQATGNKSVLSNLSAVYLALIRGALSVLGGGVSQEAHVSAQDALHQDQDITATV